MHAKVLFASVEVKLKLGLVLVVVAGGFEVIFVSGGVISITQFKLAGVASLLLDWSVARAWKECPPSANPVYVFGLAHELKAPLSRLHANVLFGSVD